MFESELPGARLKDVIASLSEDALRVLVPESTLSAIYDARSNDLQKAELASILEAGLDVEELLKRPEARRVILSALPDRKRDELNSRVGANLPLNGDVDIELRPEQIDGVVAFFGKLTQPPEVKNEIGSVERISAAFPLFAHQLDAALRVREALGNSADAFPSVLLHMPTGSGKTRTASHVACHFLSSVTHGLVVWLAGGSELLSQASESLETAWESLGNRQVQIARFWGNVTSLNIPDDGIMVAGLQKLYQAFQRDHAVLTQISSNTVLVVVDEAHSAPADTYQIVVDGLRFRPGIALLGLTATPGRTWNDPVEDSRVSQLFGHTKIGLRFPGYDNAVRALVDQGYLADTIFRRLDVEIDSEEPSSTLQIAIGQDSRDYSPTELDSTVLSHRYLSATVSALRDLLARHKRVIVFAATLRQAESITLIARATGIASRFVSGDTAVTKRKAIIAEFKRRDNTPRVLVNFGVLTTGFDAPLTSALVIARPTKSLVLFSQMVGRAIRGPEAGGNKEAEIVSVVDTRLPGFGSVADAFENWEDVWTNN